MIDEPLDFRGMKWSPADYAGQNLLFIVGGMIEFALCFENSDAVDCLWAIQPKYNWYSIGRTTCSREQFFSAMIIHYPDHLEWLLFHPEWL